MPLGQFIRKDKMKAMYLWLGKHVHTRYGTLILALLVCIEGVFFVPVSTLLAFYSLENRPKALLYALIATLASAVGALAGYLLGMLLWYVGGQALIYYFIAPEKFDALIEQFKNYQVWTTFLLALTPMPFKLLTITAGFCKLSLLPFLLLCVAARGLKFFAIASAISLWGDSVHYYLNRYFYYVVAAGIVFFVALWWFMH